MGPRGIEPRFTGPKPVVLSIKLWAQHLHTRSVEGTETKIYFCALCKRLKLTFKVIAFKADKS